MRPARDWREGAVPLTGSGLLAAASLLVGVNADLAAVGAAGQGSRRCGVPAYLPSCPARPASEPLPGLSPTPTVVPLLSLPSLFGRTPGVRPV